ncbi:exopolysaccharide exporter accessory protein [Streptococcus varani]|uniref:Capsular polysaccharide biosynthesis protein CpsC n=1 Tax=Streptococcus varani TaxID=1608583 RepID=A0A0E4H3J9_9STRE|nr:Wzz/FepE/Etk N-terminal domain-containing protein [Streptococcus varani]CQR24528.1 exopolysaccharide exporter accessory protein [Streptococcus varani]
MNTTGNANVIEIDVIHLLKKIWQKKVLIIFSALLFGVLSLLFSAFVLKPTFTSSTRIYVANQTTGNNNLTAQDLQAGSYLVNDYKEIILSDSVMSDVINREGLTISESELRSMVQVSIPSDTRIITVSVNAKEPQNAQQMANTLRVVAAEKIKVVTKVEDVTTIEEAKLPNSPSSPNIKRNVLLGAMIGGFIAMALVLLLEVLDDRVRRPEDIEEVLGLVLIGVVPDTEKI